MSSSAASTNISQEASLNTALWLNEQQLGELRDQLIDIYEDSSNLIEQVKESLTWEHYYWGIELLTMEYESCADSLKQIRKDLAATWITNVTAVVPGPVAMPNTTVRALAACETQLRFAGSELDTLRQMTVLRKSANPSLDANPQ